MTAADNTQQEANRQAERETGRSESGRRQVAAGSIEPVMLRERDVPVPARTAGLESPTLEPRCMARRRVSERPACADFPLALGARESEL